MKLDYILMFLKNNNISYQIYNPDYNGYYKPASLKKVITNGFYFNQSGFSISHIKNSVILTNVKIETNNTLIIVENPQLTHYKLCNSLKEKREVKIHPSAIIHPEAKLGKNICVGPFCVIGKSIVEDDVVLNSHIVVYDNVTLKKGVFIDSHSCIGASGLAWVWDEAGNRIMQPQIGGVIVEKYCHIATDVTIVRGSLSEDTIIGAHTVIAHGTKIGHGGFVGENVHIANNVSLAGNVNIGSRSFLGSASIVSSNIVVPKNTIIGSGAMVNKNFEEEYCTLAGIPAKIIKSNNYLNKPKGAPKPYNK